MISHSNARAGRTKSRRSFGADPILSLSYLASRVRLIMSCCLTRGLLVLAPGGDIDRIEIYDLVALTFKVCLIGLKVQPVGACLLGVTWNKLLDSTGPGLTLGTA